MNQKFEDAIKDRLGKEWFELALDEIREPYFMKIAQLVAKERKGYEVYPEPGKVFEAFKLTPLPSVKVVILGQDPYHDGNATGLAFGSVNDNPSLIKIMKQLDFYTEFGELGLNINREQSLEYLAEQGVLLLNRTLTVRRHVARSHSQFGWSTFTAKLLRKLSIEKKGIVYMLWGRDAQDVIKYLSVEGNMILTCEHPAAACYANRPWHDERCFGKCNEYLESKNKKIIRW